MKTYQTRMRIRHMWSTNKTTQDKHFGCFYFRMNAFTVQCVFTSVAFKCV